MPYPDVIISAARGFYYWFGAINTCDICFTGHKTHSDLVPHTFLLHAERLRGTVRERVTGADESFSVPEVHHGLLRSRTMH